MEMRIHSMLSSISLIGDCAVNPRKVAGRGQPALLPFPESPGGCVLCLIGLGGKGLRVESGEVERWRGGMVE